MPATPTTTTVRRHASADSFLAAAGPSLSADEARNSLPLGIAGALATGWHYGEAEPLLLTLERAGSLVGVAVCTPPHALLLSRIDAAATASLVTWLVAHHFAVPAVNAETDVAHGFADAWTLTTGTRSELGVASRLFELRRLDPTPTVAGRMRLATLDDRPVVRAWYDAFEREAAPDHPGRLPAEAHVEAGKVWLWVDASDEPVCVATRSREAPTGASIGPVYTPPNQRQNGYATALVAALSRAILDDGKAYCCLFTNLANPVSNAIYPRIGYRPIADLLQVAFRAPGA